MTKDELKKQVLGILAIHLKSMKTGLENEMTLSKLEQLDVAEHELTDEFYRRIGAPSQ